MVAVIWVAPSSSAGSFPAKFDRDIKSAAGRYLPGTDWQLYKSQLIAESGLRPAAVSPVGAKGLAQFMPGTWAQIAREMGYELVSATEPRPAIEAGAFYMAKLKRQWRYPRPEADRHSLALASYNAGLGNILKAQQLCGDPNLYSDIIQCLPRVTGHHSKETLGYVRIIWSRYTFMLLGIK